MLHNLARYASTGRRATVRPRPSPHRSLYSEPVAVRGLLGRYFANPDWAEPEALARIDEQLDLYFHVTPLPRPYTVEWTGQIAIPQSGRYSFGLISIDESELWIDGETVTASDGANQYGEADVELAAGLHDIRVRFADRTAHTHITLSWRPPWGGNAPVPSAVLLPPLGDYDDYDLPTVEDLAPLPPAPARALVGPAPAVAADTVMAEGLAAPRGIAAGADERIFVADTGNGRVLVLDGEGAVQSIIEGERSSDAALQFVEPVDLAVDAAGRLYVLDPTLARLLRIDPADGTRTVLPIAADYLDRSRGLFIGPGDAIWIANTPNRRVAAFDREGNLLHELIIPEADAQPVDVAVASDGTRYVSDAGLHRLLRYTANGDLAETREMPPANSVNGPHLTLREDGSLLVSEPETGRIVELDARGIPRAAWTLPMAGQKPAKPVGIAVDPGGRVWTVDSNLNRVVRLE